MSLNDVSTTVMVILGAPNEDSGALSPIAKSRYDKAYSEFLKMPTMKVLCTGGFGAHFNTSDTAHGELTKQYLINSGIPSSAFLEVAQSRFTFEDATLAKPIIAQAKASHLHLVTSDFHLNRVNYVFSHVFAHLTISSCAAVTPLPQTQLALLITHEEKAMLRELQNISRLLA